MGDYYGGGVRANSGGSSSASSVAVMIALMAFCSSSASMSSLAAYLFGGKLFGGSGGGVSSSSSELGKDSKKKKVAVGPAPSTSKWYETNGDDPSITHVGVVLARYTKEQVPDIVGREKDPGWVSPFLANACHADSRCTGFQVDTEKGMAWLKDHDSVPSECLDDTHRCSDSDWKKDQGKYTYFHPDRGWKKKSDAVLTTIKELDCSSGSQCKLQSILSAVSWAIMGLSFIPFGELASMALTGASMFGRMAIAAAHVAEIGMDLADTSVDAAATALAIEASRKDSTFPLDNRPVISIDDFWIGEKYDDYMSRIMNPAVTSLCYGPGTTSSGDLRGTNINNSNNGACTSDDAKKISELLNERKSRVYDEWTKAVKKWDSLPASESNDGGFTWDKVYTNAAGLAFNVIQKSNGTVQFVLPKNAESVAKKEEEFRNSKSSANAKSGATRTSARTTTKTSAPKMTPVPKNAKTQTPTKSWK